MLPLSRSLSLGAVIVYDDVTTVGTSIQLKVLTKGMIFREGGRRVNVYVGAKQVGSLLTGGDGFGYWTHRFQRVGLERVVADSGDNKGDGLVLIMGRREKAIVIEIEGALMRFFVSEPVKKKAEKGVRRIAEKYRIIYVTRFLGTLYARKLLENKEFPVSPVLPWTGPHVLERLKGRGVKLHAVISSGALLKKAADHIDKGFAFEETEYGTTLKDWEEALQRLEKEDHK